MRIGLISDTHNWIHPALFKFFADCDEIWHAGDIGSAKVADALSAFKPLRAVYGNIDDNVVRSMFKEYLRFSIEGVDVLITHIGGYPGRYHGRVAELLKQDAPDLFICGHSHIAKVQNDAKNNLLHINPGAAGYHGFHLMMTAVRFTVEDSKISDLELIELGERGKVSPDS